MHEPAADLRAGVGQQVGEEGVEGDREHRVLHVRPLLDDADAVDDDVRPQLFHEVPDVVEPGHVDSRDDAGEQARWEQPGPAVDVAGEPVDVEIGIVAEFAQHGVAEHAGDADDEDPSCRASVPLAGRPVAAWWSLRRRGTRSGPVDVGGRAHVVSTATVAAWTCARTSGSVINSDSISGTDSRRALCEWKSARPPCSTSPSSK